MSRDPNPAPFRVLCADPAWWFDDPLPGERRGALNHYECMVTSDIAAYPLPPLADDCALFLWRVTAMQRDALDVVLAWGFTLKAELVWEKKTVEGKDAFGLGRIVRGSHETCLIATRGRPVVRAKNIRSRFAAAVTQHSRKPERFYEIVEALYAGPYCELFGRQRRDNWTVLGHQVAP